jgi:hypothetical protein
MDDTIVHILTSLIVKELKMTVLPLATLSTHTVPPNGHPILPPGTGTPRLRRCFNEDAD